MAPNSTKVTALRTLPTSSLSRLSSSGSRRSAAWNTAPATNARDEARAVKRDRDAVGERGAGERDHLPPPRRDHPAAARLSDDHGDQQPGGHSAERAEPELLDQQRARAATAGDLRFHVGDRDGGEQQRHADPVVEPALDIEPLANPLRHARIADDGLPESCVRRREHDREDHGLPHRQLVEDRGGGERAQRDRQRQADAQQPHG